jgi:hypothetical protein
MGTRDRGTDVQVVRNTGLKPVRRPDVDVCVPRLLENRVLELLIAIGLRIDVSPVLSSTSAVI